LIKHWKCNIGENDNPNFDKFQDVISSNKDLAENSGNFNDEKTI
jgi:hypothetical protein